MTYKAIIKELILQFCSHQLQRNTKNDVKVAQAGMKFYVISVFHVKKKYIYKKMANDKSAYYTGILQMAGHIRDRSSSSYEVFFFCNLIDC